MSPSTFHREFKSLFRMTPTAFLIRLRIHDACLRLASSNESIGEIARQSDFNDQNLFARRFKQIMGLSPTEFRRRERHS